MKWMKECKKCGGIKRKVMKFILELIKNIIENRQLIFDLAKDDFKLRFAGAGLGAVWGFIQPLVTIALYWFVFQLGFKAGDANGVPYILWLIVGITPWFFLNEAWNGAMNCLYEYSFLVKKVLFDIEILPIVKILSSLFVHIFFIDIIFVLFASYGYYLSIYNLQVIYYLVCEVVLIYALALITSSIAVFIKDTILFIGIILQIFFWTIPIVWSSESMNVRIISILKLNPIYYLIEGFRDTFINKVWFWEKVSYTVYFWIFVMILLGIGIWMYKRLNKYFADLL